MRCISISLWALIALLLVPSAHAENSSSGKASAGQMDRGVSLSSPPTAPSTPDPTPDLTRSLQAELKRVGCFEGAVDGVWDGRTKTALVDFGRRAKLEVATDAPTAAAVETLKSRRDRVCPLECGPGRIERNGQCVAKAAPEAKPAKETRRPPREKSEDDRSKPSMCWRDDGRTTALVPCSEAPTGRRAY